MRIRTKEGKRIKPLPPDKRIPGAIRRAKVRCRSAFYRTVQPDRPSVLFIAGGVRNIVDEIRVLRREESKFCSWPARSGGEPVGVEVEPIVPINGPSHPPRRDVNGRELPMKSG